MKLLLLALVLLTGCDVNTDTLREPQVMKIDDHIYLKSDYGHYKHDPFCPECKRRHFDR